MKLLSVPKAGTKKYIPVRILSFIILILHLWLICTVVIDCIKPIDSSKEYKYFSYLIASIKPLVEYSICSDIRLALLSSVLVIWTFITAASLYYLGKKDTVYFGISMWKIILFDITPLFKKSFFFLFFFELFLILLSTLINLPVTVTYFSFLYAVTATFLLYFISVATTEEFIKKRHFQLIINQYNKTTANSNFPDKKIPALSTYLKKIPFFTEQDWEYLIQLLPDIFISLCNNKEERQSKEAKILLYNTMNQISSNINTYALRKCFLEGISKYAYQKTRNGDHSFEILAAMFLPVLETTDSSGYCYFLSPLSVIPDDIIRHKLLLYGIVYTAYLDFVKSTSRYSIFRNQLIERAAEEKEKQDSVYILEFVQKLQSYTPEFVFKDMQ